MPDGARAPDRKAWLAFSEEQRATDSPEVARATVAYFRAVDRRRRALLVALAVGLLAVPAATRLVVIDQSDRGWVRLVWHGPVIWVEAIPLALAYHRGWVRSQRSADRIRNQARRWLSLVIAARPPAMTAALVVRRRRRSLPPFVGPLLAVGYLLGLGAGDAHESAVQALLAVVAFVTIVTIGMCLYLGLWRSRPVLRVDDDGLVVAVDRGAGPGGDHVIIPWPEITAIAPELDAVVIQTSWYVPTARFSRFRQRDLPPIGPTTRIEGGYRISLRGTGVRPETVYWAIEDKLSRLDRNIATPG